MSDTEQKAMTEMISGYLDGELTQQESQRVAVLIRTQPEWQQLYEELNSMRNDLKQAEWVSADARDLPKILGDGPSQWLGVIGWSVLILGALAVSLFVGWEVLVSLWQDNSTPWWFKFGIVGFYGGFVLLFLMVLRQRLIARKTDKYRKVKL
ncbi:MAG: hypothetical protein JJU10_00590 [Idiomarina sp.]|nr:hypothetical protein [Idiomarina sp.]